MRGNGHFTLTSPEGQFIFPSDTLMSHAKLVRDTVTANVRGFRGDSPAIRRQTNLKVWLKDNLMGPASKVQVQWVPVSLEIEELEAGFDRLTRRFDLLGVAAGLAKVAMVQFAEANSGDAG